MHAENCTGERCYRPAELQVHPTCKEHSLGAQHPQGQGLPAGTGAAQT